MVKQKSERLKVSLFISEGPFFRAGYKAYNKGWPRDCPYKHPTAYSQTEKNHWYLGWDEAWLDDK